MSWAVGRVAGVVCGRIVEATGEVGPVFQRLELGFTKRVVVADVRAAVGLVSWKAAADEVVFASEGLPDRSEQVRFVHLAAQHGHFMAQHEDSAFLDCVLQTQQSQPGQDLPEDQIQQSDRHARRSCPTTAVQRCR